MRLASVVGLALVAGLVVMPVASTAVPSAAAGADCPATPYPGDGAAKSDIAGWMARGAAARGIPGELPVMAALVESGLVNLKVGDADAKGYFQMRETVWSGTYPGFPDDPELQLDWFLDQAASVRSAPYPPEAMWGEWAADVERPASQYRYRYQLRLADARALMGTPCTAPDIVAPTTQVIVSPKQRVRHGIEVTVSCPAEQCVADVRARLKLGKRPELVAPPATLAAGQAMTFRLRLKRSVRRLVTGALHHHQKVRAKVTVTTTDPAGNTNLTTHRITIRL